MTTLLELKEKLVHFYGKNEVYITPIIKFLLAFASFLMINDNIGYMERISTMPIALLLALVCSVLPIGATVLVGSVLILLDLYALSLEVCLVGLLLFVLIYFLYFRFSPKHEYNIILTPLCFGVHIPYLIPVATGLLKEMYSLFSLICGTVLFFFLDGVKQNQAALGAAEETEDATSKIVVALNQLVGNREMYLVLGVMVAAVIIVYLIRRMSIEHAWAVAIISGILFQAIGLIAGYMLLGIAGKTVEVLIGCVISCAVAFVLQFLFFNLDYSRTERLQFEDDEYYYYVKAVPKAIVSGTEKKVTRFGGKEKGERMTRKRFAEEMDIDEDLLD